MTECFGPLYDGPVRHRIFFLIFIVSACVSRLVWSVYGGYEYAAEKITGTVYREVWNRADQMVLEPDDRQVRILVTSLKEQVKIGSRVTVFGTLRQPEAARNPGGYSQRDTLYGKNVLLVLETDRIEIHSDFSFCLRAWGSGIRAHIEKVLSPLMDDQELGFLLGVMTGETGGLEDSEKAWIRLSGISHLMAVSGMHVTYILLPVKRLLKRRRLDIAARSGLCMLPLLLFMTAAGFTPSVIRAGVMCGYTFVSKIVNRKPDLLNSLGLAGCVCFFVCPMAAGDIGFVLSFSAVLSGTVLGPPISSLFAGRKKTGKLLDPLCYGLAVNMGLLPVMLYHFNMFSLSGLLVNLAAAPLSSALCVLGYSTYIVGSVPLFFVAAEFMAAALTSVAGLLTATARIGAAFPVIRSVSPPLWLAAVYYVLVLWLAMGRKHFRLRAVFSAAVALVLAAGAVSAGEQGLAEIVWYDVGQGSCALVTTEGGSHILIDGGAGFVNVSQLLWKKGVSHVDWVILSHGDTDHSEGLMRVAQEHSVGTVLIPDNPEDTKAQELAEAVRRRGGKVVKVGQFASVFLTDRVQIELYRNQDTGSFNNSSLVVQLNTDFGSVLFPGDLEQEGEQSLAESGFLRKCGVITASHHGAKNGTGELILQQSSPFLTVISVGKQNRYGHPSPETLQRIAESGARIVRTDQDGAVIMRFQEDGRIEVATWLTKEKLQYRK